MNKLKIILETKLEFYRKLDKKIEKILNSELTLEDWSNEVNEKIILFEKELDGFK